MACVGLGSIAPCFSSTFGLALRRVGWLALLVASGVAASPSARAGTEREFFIVENARVLVGDPSDANWIEGATIVVRDGLIFGVGVGVDLPPDHARAERVDATGAFVYPSWIDALSYEGISSRTRDSRNSDAPPDYRAGPAPATRSARRIGTTPERDVLDVWEPESGALDAARRLALGAAHVGERGGLFAGKTAVVSLGAGSLRENVIASAAGMRGGLSSSGSGYPRSLMGRIAHVRQTLLDARHYREVHAVYRRSPRGLPRPPLDTSLESLGPVVDGTQTLYFLARSVNDIARALRLASEFDLRLTITGATSAHELVEPLRDAGVAIVLVPEFDPKEPELRRGVDALPLRVQEDRRRTWRESVGTAQRLAEGGVSFAFGSASSGDFAALFGRVRTALKHGLDEGAAVRALTLSAAEILGVDETIGSIEVGKTASFALWTARITDEKARVRELFVDGARFEFAEPDENQAKDEEKSAETKAEGEPKPPEAKDAPPKEGDEPAAEKKEGEKSKPEEPPPTYATELDEDRIAKVRTGGDVLLRGGTVITMASRDAPSVADVLIRGGKIAGIGATLEATDGVEIVDCAGWFVMPGIVDCHSHLAIEGGVNESSLSITCEVRIEDVLNSRDLGIYRAAAGGVTTSNLLHGSANTIGGQNAVVRSRYRAARDRFLFPDAPPGVKFALGENVRHSNFSTRRGTRYPISRMGVETVIRRAFAEADAYRSRWGAHAEATARGERRLPPRRDLRLETLSEIRSGTRWIHAHCYRADEIEMLLRAARELDLPLATLQHVLEGYKVAPEIAAAGVGASTFSDWWAYKLEAYDAIPHNAALLARAGVVSSVNSDDREMVRRLNHEAAKSVRAGGLDHHAALELITTGPARQLGIFDRVGSLEVGKDGDVAVFDAHPLSVYARCRYTFVEGEIEFARPRAEGDAPKTVTFAPVTAELPPAPDRNGRHVYLLKGARVHPVSSPPIEGGDVLIESGKITAVGVGLEAPSGAMIVDLEGRFVFPGWIDAGTYLGLAEINSVYGSVDRREVGEFQPDLLATTAVNAHSELIPVARFAGTTSALVSASGPVVAGQTGLIQLAGSSTGEAVLETRVGLRVRLPSRNRDDKKDPEGVERLEEFFASARRYHAGHASAREAGSALPPIDPRFDSLRPYLDKTLPVLFDANREIDIRLAIKVAERLDVRPVICGGREGWKIVDLLAERKIPMILGPVHALPMESFDPYDAPYENPGILVRAGIPIAFQSSDASNAGNLPYQIGTAVAFGLPWEKGLEALTLGAAKILGADDELGSIEPGKRADLIVTDGDPFEMTTHVLRMFIAGRPVDLESRHTRLYREFRDRRELPAGKTRRF